jgi:cell division transport system permease protein
MARQSKPTKFYATVSTSIVLLMLSLFLLLFLHSKNITSIAKEQLNVLVELENGIGEANLNYIIEKIKTIPTIKTSSIQLIPKDQAMSMMGNELISIDTVSANPFKDIVKFNLNSKDYTENNIKSVKETIELEKGVSGFYHENENIEVIKENLNKVSLGLLFISICFILLAITIIFNTIKLTLYSDEKEILTMQMVGAENKFIKRPYLRDAFWMATKAAVVMIVILGLGLSYIYSQGNILSQILDIKYIVVTLIIAASVAYLLQIVTTNSILNKFLQSDYNRQ